MKTTSRYVTVLLVEDDPGDVLLVEEALLSLGRPRAIHSVGDGVQAWDFLRRRGEHANAPRPDVVLLDLNMPRMDGRELLALIKDAADLKTIPVLVFTTSTAQEDVLASYDGHANAYVVKPVDLDELTATVHQIDDFFTTVALLPSTS
jgi:CheY-like chemotaxis protein